MSSFSERQGIKPKKVIQIDSMDDELRNRLWNVLQIYFWSEVKRTPFSISTGHPQYNYGRLGGILTQFWDEHLKRPYSEKSSDWRVLYKQLDEHFSKFKWYEYYEAIEYLAPYADKLKDDGCYEFILAVNKILDDENSAYRFVGNTIAPITNEIEVDQIEKMLMTPYDTVRIQIQSALDKMSAKPEGDYRNSIKESIGAVETAVKLAASDKNGTLSKLLPLLKDKIGLHQAQIDGFIKLYGYTSDEKSGIRHAMMDKDTLTSDDARYMLVTCSAFANYILRLAERAGILT